MIILNIESAIVGFGISSSFFESIISGNVKIKAKIPKVNVNLLIILSREFSKLNIAPRRKNIEKI